MPRTTREYLLRHADQALNDYDRALEKLAILKGTYGETHPQHAKLMEVLALQTVQISEALKTFRMKFM